MKFLRILPAFCFLALAAAPALYYQVGLFVYFEIAKTDIDCTNHAPYNTPAEFSPHLYPENVEGYTHEWNQSIAPQIDQYYMETWENATIYLEEEPITISAWYVEQNSSSPWVILVHGIRSCKANHEVLIPAGMLAKNGFNVLMLDLRDHWQSTVEDELVSAGQREWRDVHAAWTWLQDEKAASPQQIGLYGASMGAGTAALAFAQEPLIHAAFLDSVYYSMDKILREELEYQGLPSVLVDAGVFAGKVYSGDDIVDLEPYEAAEKINNRWMFIAQSTNDTRIRMHHGENMCEAASANSQHVECWFADSAVQFTTEEGEEAILAHVTLMLTQPNMYEEKLVEFFNNALTPE